VKLDIAPTAEYPRHSEGDTIRLADGRMLLAWTRFRGREDHATAEIVGMVGEKMANGNGDGPTWQWGEPAILVSAQEAQQNVMSVSLLREAASRDLLLFYLRKNSFADCRVFLRRSTDEGRTWGEAEPVCQTGGYHVMNNARVVQTGEGRLLAPVALTQDYEQSRHQVAFCYLSDDGGASWRPSLGWVDLPTSTVGCQEPGIVEHEDGLLLYVRTDLGHVYATTSSDGGETWGALQPLHDLPAPAAPATMARLPDGGDQIALIAVYNHRPDGASAGWADRTPLALARSDDHGDLLAAHWRRLADIESDPQYCYGYTSIRVEDGLVWLSYYVWPRQIETSFLNTGLRLRALPLSRFC
jgi:sialidase-1